MTDVMDSRDDKLLSNNNDAGSFVADQLEVRVESRVNEIEGENYYSVPLTVKTDQRVYEEASTYEEIQDKDAQTPGVHESPNIEEEAGERKVSEYEDEVEVNEDKKVVDQEGERNGEFEGRGAGEREQEEDEVADLVTDAVQSQMSEEVAEDDFQNQEQSAVQLLDEQIGLDEKVEETDQVFSTETTSPSPRRQEETEQIKPRTSSSSSTSPSTAGKFVIRSVSRADPIHVVQSILQSEQNSPQTYEQDELVRYLKVQSSAQTSESDATTPGEMKQKIHSWITSNLVQQFNKEAETGNETSKLLMPRRSYVSSQLATHPPAASPAPRPTQLNYDAVDTSQMSGTQQDNDVTVTLLTLNGSPVVEPFPVAEPVVPVLTGEMRGSVDREENSTTESVVKVSATVSALNKKSEPVVKVSPAKQQPVQPVKVKPQTESDVIVVRQTSEVSAEVNGAEVKTTTNSVSSPVTNSLSPPTSPVEHLNSINGSTTLPNWKAEVERRKQTKDYIVAQKPGQPIKLYETPAWKKALQEKNKTRKSAGEYPPECLSPTGEAGVENGTEADWKVEMRQIMKQKSLVADEDNPLAKKPEWQQIAEK